MGCEGARARARVSFVCRVLSRRPHPQVSCASPSDPIDMRVSTSFLSFARRLIPSVFGISKQGVRIESGALCPDLSSSSSGSASSCVVQVGEDTCFVAPPTDSGYQVLGIMVE